MSPITHNEFKESFYILFDILTEKEKIKLLKISLSAVKNKKDSKIAKRFIRAAQKEYTTYIQREEFDQNLIDGNFFNEDCDIIVDNIVNDCLQEVSRQRVYRLIKLSMIFVSYCFSDEEREYFYNIITDLDRIK